MINKKTELLAPAGSLTALKAAIEGGADAIYMGGESFNARINAKNFTPQELQEGITLAHSYGVKIYITANTLIFDREREDFLQAAERAYLLGADALIVADLGAAAEIKKRIPIELHASTQLSGHNTAAAERLAECGFSRMVLARELPREDIAEFCRRSPIEAEVFVHGALCVSTSGQCLFSSIVGGRSGNRGECAQPCRLPYSGKGGKAEYPLSLRDLSLAGHLRELVDMGIASLKIEGRMKSPEYVRDVTSVFRRLLDEGRNATAAELSELAKVFSRGGLTDGYFARKVDRKMLGVRSELDKKQTAALPPFEKIERRLPLSMQASIHSGVPMELTATCGERSVTVTGDSPMAAINAPLSREAVTKNLSKLGSTPFELASLELSLDEGVMLPLSAINALRRAATDALSATEPRRSLETAKAPLLRPEGKRGERRTAVFYDPKAIPDEAYDYFDKIFVPLEHFEGTQKKNVGVMLPEVIFDSQRAEVEQLLSAAKKNGAASALVGNIGHLELARSAGLELFGDFRLNISNSSTAAEVLHLGLEGAVLSPELTLAQLRDIGGATSAVVYGRLPLMLTEKCVGRELGGCEACGKGALTLTDRKGVAFPVLRRYGHRSAVFNSVPVYMADRLDVLAKSGICAWHFIFSTESKKQAAAIISAYSGRPAETPSAVRRIK